MPELPEVEIVRRQLDEELGGACIAAVEVLLPRLVKYPNPTSYRRGLRGRTVRGVGRRGKYLLIHLDDDRILVIHLGMTGSLRFASPGVERPRHTHLVFRLEDGRELLFVDPRTFGETALLREGDFRPLPGLHRLGPEPLDERFTLGELRRALRGRCRIKAALLDQSRVAGIGNIYADEALHRAGIHPLRHLDELSPREVTRLHRAIREVLREAIERGGSSVSDYVDTRGEKGNFQDHHRVYRRAGKPCPRCGEMICRKRLAGRSTYFCPRCQR
ncbi:bifunctional DNA-formamidopyrimidine glycosylase/DNA-(apurinic or apyrimidinic site) lyase [Candidatus Solincola sp.]|nr:bifunctional DNA-formamidopyrimidine glycosylase/DNA-(apurinic or apyrimidinic site) lyase [Actinomycetota bacterium]MDI7251594.1 bifunctional DNA-formamidopyrimidine glycosylase/DNA-(apurinic or apyrimidinic site) lyase [Actinomycetota bacterium]